MQGKEYKRQTREMPQEIKNKISSKLQNRPKTEQHKQHISQGLIQYWSHIPK